MTDQPPDRPRPDFIPALRFHTLTPAYDLVVRLTVRDASHKQALVRQAAIQPGEAVLDAGCGSGTTAVLLTRQRPGSRIAGLDADPSILHRAKRKTARNGARVDFVCGRIEEQPFRTGSFDCVLSGLVLHHLDRQAKLRALAELNRVLKPGGRLHLVDWGRPANAMLAASFLLVRILDGFEVTEDNANGRLASLLEDAGFGSIRTYAPMSTLVGTLEFLSGIKTDRRPVPKAGAPGDLVPCT